MMFRRRLWLVGDDEVLDAIADLSRHLDYFQVARLDEPPPPPLGPDDHVVVAMESSARGEALLRRVQAERPATPRWSPSCPACRPARAPSSPPPRSSSS